MIALYFYRMKKKIVVCCLFLSTVVFPYAQSTKHTENVQQVWLGYFNQTRISDKWGLWADFHLRTKDDFVHDLSQSIVRLGISYYLSDAARFTIGYAYVNNFPGDNHSQISQVEHRPWQQFQWNTVYGKKRMMQWIRLEEKFRRKILNDSTLGSGYTFNYKVRYNLWYEIPFSKKGVRPHALSFIANDEIHINFGKQIIYNYFDQNRFFAGIKYQASAQTNIQAGYMNLFQQLAAGNRYKNIHAIRIFYFQNLDLRRKK